MIAVVDIGRGNLLSVCNALSYLGEDPRLCTDPHELRGAARVVLPGVGAFADGMRRLVETGFADALQEFRATGRPVIGLCLGMQLLADRSFEGGETAGLGWVAGDVRRLDAPGLRIPHVGWNAVSAVTEHALFRDVPNPADFYFVHSFQLECANPDDVLAIVDYGGPVVAAVHHGNVAGTQFHPEKSQERGLAVLDGFLRWNP